MTDKKTDAQTELTQADLENALKEMCNLLSKNNDSSFIYEFFGCLFTPAELNDFAKRWLLVREIDKGTTQREIAKKFHISLCKITRGSRELKKEDSAFRKLLDYADSI
ncbi:MAG: transcriptional regulator [Treponema sp.]|uniref:Trp family transcriptional regulator n=1 Tax=Treponema sp. TaxID=166 RepID=UPI001B789CA4|nr:Trp family transcriptional regulator [Treponema sp.]MBP3773131.1 transcriptional regulator [Treponema sp.]MBQ9282342.1 transcriptional regulator [Treponema sp.]